MSLCERNKVGVFNTCHILCQIFSLPPFDKLKGKQERGKDKFKKDKN